MDTARLISRHDTPSNLSLFRMDVNTLEAALTRRLKMVNINEVLETYNCFCIPRIASIDFGGVFHCSLREEILTQLKALTYQYSSDITKLKEEVKIIRAEMTQATIDLLAPFRWMRYDDVRRIRFPPSTEQLIQEIESAFPADMSDPIEENNVSQPSPTKTQPFFRRSGS